MTKRDKKTADATTHCGTMLLNGPGYFFVETEDRAWVKWIAEAFAQRNDKHSGWMWQAVEKSWNKSTLRALMLAGF